jgi:chorismate mutase
VPTPDAQPLSAQSILDLRAEIDRIDGQMHELLISRGEIINRLIEIKRRQGGGSAFRPDREAAMMRTLAERHRGLLPLDTVEGVWRIIISTFTYAQARYSVHVDLSGGDAAMRDSARFHFGFTVPYVAQASAAAVINAVARSDGDLGLVRIDGGAAAGAWWSLLADPAAPKIIARLPFVERPNHPAGVPVFVISRPLAEAAAREEVLYSVLLERWREAVQTALVAHGAQIVENASHEFGLSLIVAAPAALGYASLYQLLSDLGLGDFRIAEIGSHASRFDFSGGRAQERRA